MKEITPWKIVETKKILCGKCKCEIGEDNRIQRIAQKTGNIRHNWEKTYYENYDQEGSYSYTHTDKPNWYTSVRACNNCYEVIKAEIEKQKAIEIEKAKEHYKEELEKINAIIIEKNYFIVNGDKNYSRVIGVTEGRDIIMAHTLDGVVRIPSKGMTYQTNAPILFAKKGRLRYDISDFYDLPINPEKVESDLIKHAKTALQKAVSRKRFL